PYIIRAAIAMLMLACSIPGQSRIQQAAPIRRAHPRFAENITRLGARVDWVDGA
ncbi:MAG: UDP-N-acetylglucosamine 1-carboxyvinyltransferase, partial [Rubrivivax sp.]